MVQEHGKVLNFIVIWVLVQQIKIVGIQVLNKVITNIEQGWPGTGCDR